MERGMFRKLLAATRLGPAAAIACLAITLLGQSVSASGAAVAKRHLATAARTMSINESANLKIVHQEYHHVEARGQTYGTFKGAIVLHYSIDTGERSSSSFVTYPSGGRMYGGAICTYRVSGGNSYFAGNVKINGGTGRYRHAYGTAIHISGILERWHLRMSIHITGKLRV